MANVSTVATDRIFVNNVSSRSNVTNGSLINSGLETTTNLTSLYFFQAINICLILIVLWIFVNMIVFGMRTKKWRTSSDSTKMDRGKIFIVCIVAVASSLPRLILSQVLFHASALSRCEVLMDVGIVAFSISIWLVYFFLWLRHRAIYGHPTVKKLMGKYSNFVSWFLLIIVSVVSLAVMIGFVIPHDYVLARNGCVIRVSLLANGGQNFWDVGSNYILGGFLFVSQLSFVSLFIYPMVVTKKMRMEQQRQEMNGDGDENTSRRQGTMLSGICGVVGRKREADNISSTIYRSVISSAIAVSTDLVVAFLVAMVIPGTVSRAITVTIYDISLVVNIFCIIATFGSNNKILFILCRRSLSRSLSSASLSSMQKSNKTASTEMW